MPNSNYNTSFPTRALVLGIVVIVAGYIIFRAIFGGGDQQQAQQMQAMPVQVSVINPHPVQIWKEFSARLVAVDYVQLRPQISGRIKEVRFEDGQSVEASDILFVIDPRPF